LDVRGVAFDREVESELVLVAGVQPLPETAIRQVAGAAVLVLGATRPGGDAAGAGFVPVAVDLLDVFAARELAVLGLLSWVLFLIGLAGGAQSGGELGVDL
jgi:hypothetical protein